MDRFEQFKSKFPEFSNLSNGEIVNLVSQYTGADPQRVYSEFGGEQNRSAVGDIGTALKIGVQRLPETVTGLGDVLVAPITGRASISDAADSLGRATGFRPGQWANDSQLNYSPAQQQFLQQGAQTEGFTDTAAHYLTNPMRSVVQGVESVPGMALGGVYARGLRGLGGLSNPARFGAGEGGVMAGQAMNQMVEDGVDPRRAAGYAAGVGALGGVMGGLGGRFTERLGGINPDQLLGGGGRTLLREGAEAPGLMRRVGVSALGEGGLEEMPQSAMEAVMGNLAAERPWDQDVGKQAAAGLVLGGLMGGVVGVVPPARNPSDPIDILNRDTVPQPEAAPQVGQSELNFGVTGEEAIGTRGLRNPFDAAGYVSGFQQGQETTVDVPQSDLFGGVNEMPPVDIPRTPKIDIPVPQPLQSDPVRSAVAQASPATLRKDGSLKDIVEKALGAYSEFSDGEIAAALEEFAASKRKDTVWRVAALEAIARQRAAQGAPNVAQVDAASGQGAGAVPAGSAGNTPSGPVVLDGVRQPAGAPAPGSAARVPVGEPVVQQPSGLTEGAQPANVPPTQQVAPQAQEAGGQESAQVGVPLRPTHRNQVAPDAVQVPKLAQVQQQVFDYLVKAVRESRMDDVVDAEGVFQYAKIGAALGKKRGSIKAAVDGAVRRIAQSQGVSVEQFQAALRQRALDNRRVEDSDYNALGLSPYQQPSVVDGADVFGNDEGVSPSMEIVDSPAKTNSGGLDAETLGGTEEGDALLREAGALTPRGLTEANNATDPVAERRAAEARARRKQLEAEMAALNLEAEMTLAEVNWDSTVEEAANKIRAPKFAELPSEAQLEFALVSREYEAGGIDEETMVGEVRAIAVEVKSNGYPQEARPAESRAVAQAAGAVQSPAVERTESPRTEGVGQEAGAREEVASTPAFKRWFGSSVVVDARGEPLVVYHGTRGDFSVFSEGEIGSATDRGFAGPAFYFTNNAESASSYAEPSARNQDATGGNVMPVYLKIERPYYVPEGQDTLTPEQEQEAHSGRYDGIINRMAEDDGYVEYAVFRPEQIKSATGNNGQFDGANPDIRYSRTTDTQGTTVEAVRSAINAIATPMGRRKVTVYQTADEAVQSGALNSKDAKGTQGWVDAEGNAFFIAGNIPNGSELAVVLHEIGAHLGIEKLLTDAQYESLVKKIFDWAQSDANTQEAQIARAALARVDAAKLENEADLAPETIAYFVEEAVKAGVNPTAMQYNTGLGRWFRTLWAAFKVALRRLNLINADRLTAQNVVDLAYGAARVELASAYHGTAANFRRFDHRFMGSGEGAQAFGWGTYLAQRFGIANEYFEADVGRKSGVLYKGEAIKQSWPRGQEPTDLEAALAAVAARFADSYSLRKALQKGTVTASDFKSAIADAQYELASDNDMAAHDALENVRPEDFGVGQAEGNIHIVDVNFTEDEMLDWDKPLSEQSEVVKVALERIKRDELLGDFVRDGYSGSTFYKVLGGRTGLGSDKAASEYLDSLGIKGIKFLDAKSRGNPSGILNWSQQRAEGELQRSEGILAELEAAQRIGDGDYQAEINDLRKRVAGLRKLVAEYSRPKTRNLVVFNDRNIYRVGSMRGGPVDKGGRMMFSKAADPQLTELAQESGQRAWAAIRAGVRKGWTGLAFSSHLANAAHRAGLTSARALELVQRKKATRAYEIQIEVEKVLSKFADLKGQTNGRPTSEVVQRFIYDSTFDKKWGFAPDWKQDAVVDPEMESRFNALPTEAQTVIKDVFRHGDAIFKEKQDLLRKTITGEYEALIKAETDDGKRRKLERQRDKELREAGRLIAEMNGPYAPLRRYGNYVVVAKSQKYRDAEAAGPVDAKLKRDENHYVVEFAETLYEAERLKGVLEGKFGKGLVWAGEKETATEQFGELPFMAVQRLRKMVDTDLDGDLNTKSKRVLNKLLVDLYISTLHEANARHSEQKRQFVNRADRDTAAKDMMRAFATQGRADSHLVSALQFNSEIVDEMQKLRNEAKNGQGDSLLKTRLRNEILQRHMMDLDFRETPVQDKLMSLNSFWMLLTSPGYYVQNATQVMMMTQPVLAGKFGQNRSMRQLMRGYQDAMRVLKGSSWNEAADLSRFNGTSDEKTMLIELQARGTLDFGISAELGYWESRGEISKVFNQVMRKVGMGTRKLEVLNRMSSALAAYRLMYDQTTGTQAKRHAAALDYADSIIKDTHGDYSTTNAPRYLRMMPKVMTQFRKFQLIQLSLFAKVIHGSVKGASPQEKRAMRAALGYLFMNHALLAGAVGVPASALLGAIYAIAGDDDDPNDWEVDVRRAIGDKEMADLILHGLPSLININMSNKIGAGTMLDPLPFVEYEATRGGYEKAVTAAMGPLIWGLGAQVVDAFGRILKGDVAQGTAQLLPRGFRDAARGFMAAQDGIQLRNGQTALTPEELSFYDSLMMGLGLPTLKTTSRTETQFKSQQYEQFFRERVTKLKRQYSEAYEENDREAMLEARQAWAEMQASRKNLGFKVQPLSELLKAPREKAKAEAKLQGGVRTTEQARGFVQSLQ